MKIAFRLITLLFLSALIIIGSSSCKKDDASNGPDSSGDLYLNFNLDGNQKDYTSKNGFWGGNSGSDVSTWASLDGFIGGDITLYYKGVSEITFDDLIDLEGKTISFDSEDAIYARLVMDQDGIDASTGQINMPSANSTLTITDTHEELGFGTINPLGKIVRITGTFKCEMGETSGSQTYSVSDGEFSLAFQEFLD
ncbi:MAG: hypothetical protein AB8F94_07740 [Saprospiraceae bacterium]